MSWMNTTETYGSVTKFFHWLIFLLVVGLVIAGLSLHLLEGLPYEGLAYTLHKLTGLTVLSLMILRLLWKIVNANPISLNIASPVLHAIERTIHFAFYVVLLVMPLSGWIMSTAADKPPQLLGIAIVFPGVPVSKPVAEFFAAVHMWTAWLLIGLITVHVFAALKHHFIDKDNVLRRMLPGRN